MQIKRLTIIHLKATTINNNNFLKCTEALYNEIARKRISNANCRLKIKTTIVDENIIH